MSGSQERPPASSRCRDATSLAPTAVLDWRYLEERRRPPAERSKNAGVGLAAPPTMTADQRRTTSRRSLPVRPVRGRPRSRRRGLRSLDRVIYLVEEPRHFAFAYG